jgi:hypothetical protein
MTNDDPASLQPPPRVITFDGLQLQKKYKHAKAFGITANYNPDNLNLFEQKLTAHVINPNVQRIEGTLRGVQVIHYVDLETNLIVVTTRDGKFVSAWELSITQIQHVLDTGDLGGS